MAPDQLSMFSRAGDIRSSNATAPSAPSNGSMRADFLPDSSETASCSRAIAGCDLHPKACRRNRALKRHACPLVLGIHVSVREILAEILSAEVQLARIMDGQGASSEGSTACSTAL